MKEPYSGHTHDSKGSLSPWCLSSLPVKENDLRNSNSQENREIVFDGVTFSIVLHEIWLCFSFLNLKKHFKYTTCDRFYSSKSKTKKTSGVLAAVWPCEGCFCEVNLLCLAGPQTMFPQLNLNKVGSLSWRARNLIWLRTLELHWVAGVLPHHSRGNSNLICRPERRKSPLLRPELAGRADSGELQVAWLTKSIFADIECFCSFCPLILLIGFRLKFARGCERRILTLQVTLKVSLEIWFLCGKPFSHNFSCFLFPGKNWILRFLLLFENADSRRRARYIFLNHWKEKSCVLMQVMTVLCEIKSGRDA